VIGIAAEKPEDLQQYKGKLKGAIVVVGRATEDDIARESLLTPWGEETIPVARPKSDDRSRLTMTLTVNCGRHKRNSSRKKVLEPCCAARKNGTALLNMGTAGREYGPSQIPTAYMNARELHPAVEIAGRGSSGSRSEH